MIWVLIVVVVTVAAALLLSRQQQTRAAELREAESLERVRRVADEDVTRFGEELTGLHVDTLTTELDTPMRQDYQRALDCYDSAKSLLYDARRAEDITPVTRTLEDGRYAMACVLARTAGEPLPTRRPPCFFNPAHGPAATDVSWAPGGGEPREIPVCLADADRLAQGAEPDVRQVRRGNQMVPWFQGGRPTRRTPSGYYGGYALNGLFPGFVLGSMLGGWGGGWGDTGDTGGDAGDGGDAGGDYGEDAGGDSAAATSAAATSAAGTSAGSRRGAAGGRPRRASRSSTGRP